MRKYGLLAGILIAFFLAAGTASAWWDASWTYKKPINITGTGTELTNYQVALNVTYNANMQTDFDDLRFVDTDDSTEIDFWLEEKVDSSWAYVWVEVPTIAASGNTTIYMYYGNSSVSNASDIKNTFDIADDFNDGSIDGSIWGTLGTVTESNGYAKVARGATAGQLYSDYNHSLPLTTRALMLKNNTASAGTDHSRFRVYESTDPTGDYEMIMGYHSSTSCTTPKQRSEAYDEGGYPGSYCMNTDPYNSFVEYIMIVTTSTQDAEVNGVSATQWTKTYTDVDYGIEFNAYDNSIGVDMYVDWVYVKEYLATEPDITVGSEETNSSDNPPTINISTPQNTTYYTTSIVFNFSVSDAEDATFHVIAYNDTDAIYDSAAYANNTLTSFTLSETGGQQNVTVWANDSAGNEETSTVLYYVWMGLNVSAYNNATNASMTNWSITAANGTFTYTNGSQNNPSLIEWNLLPQGSVNITIDDNSTTLYFYNTTYERTLNNSAIVQLDAYLQPKSENPISLFSSAGWSMLQGQSTTITCTASETTPELKVNSVLVASPYTFTVQIGQYVAACNVYNETENYAPKNVSNIIVVNPLISCTSNETFAYSATITTATNLTTLDFTTFANQNTVRSNLGDVYIPLANDTWINTTGGSYVIVNNTGQSSFTVYFGNYYANKSYNTSSLQGDQKNITTYTQINPSIIYNVLDELTGEYMFPPNATLTSIIHCSLGETYIQIDEGDSKILIASSAYLDKASLRVLYTADAYYSRQLYPTESDALALSFYVVDALQNALDRIDFFMEDINYYSAKLQVYKTVQSEILIITEGYFDASHYFSVYLMEDSDYYMRTVGTTGTITDFGRITIVAPATKTLGQVTMDLNPQATLISDNILMNAWANTGRTALYIAYSDATNKTENVTITVYFANGTVFQNGTYAAQAVNLEYNITDYSNESFTVDFSLWHETFGNSPVSYAMGVFPGIAWDIGVNSTLYALYSLVLLILVGGIATRHSIVAGSVLFLITMIMLYFIGWLPVSRVSIVFIAVLLVLGIIVSSKQEGK